MSLKFKVSVPATSANIGVGYDCLGVALDYKLELEEGFVPDVVGRLTVRYANGMNIRLTKRK